jgi:CRP-like cAMP-binding protein
MRDISLRDVYMFGQLTDEKIAEIEAVLEVRRLETGETLFSQGEPGDELFIVQQGQMAIYSPSEERPGEEKPIRLFRRGGILGEMALIDRQPRSLSARALEPTWLLALKGDDFRRLLRQDSELAFAVMVGLNDRVRYTTEFLNEVRAWVGRMGQGEYSRDDFLQEVRGWVKQVAEGDYEQDIEAEPEKEQYRDATVANLAAEFAQMAAEVRQREEKLRQEIAQLKVEIDESKRQQDVAEITGTDYFKSLKAQVKSMKQDQEDE